jgi:Uma2 family endonuclease
VRTDDARVRRPGGTYFIPDVLVFPVELARPFRDLLDVLEVYDDPLPLIVEVWSRSTGDYDLTEKQAVYKERGDLEIWLIHPYERTLMSWVWQRDSSYRETVDRDGVVQAVALPGVTIDLEQLFA